MNANYNVKPLLVQLREGKEKGDFGFCILLGEIVHGSTICFATRTTFR